MLQIQILARIKNSLLALWHFRGFILGSVQREFQARYRNSMLGAAWMVLNPLSMIFVYTVIFTKLMHPRLPSAGSQFSYGIYLCAGLLTWGLFTDSVSRLQNVFIENGNLIKKQSFPRSCLPIISIMNALINFTIIFGLFLIFLLITGNFPGWVFLGLIPVLLIQILFSIGLGVILGVLNVFFRDVGQLFGIVLQFWFWFTPIVYTASILPEEVQPLLKLNPMASLIIAYQGIFVSGVWPQWSSLWPATLISGVLCLCGMALFRKHVGEMADEL
ncbi:ABC transporter permease [Solimicrobium silvestre]|uniref:Transport permease protein n=1 Tax=Solimicrobium silvestre TaxID=2099400 RepID=A0A2S9H1U7_9BURK|nr:ABC transporter permease [Solimicrobium silvestre]PRC93965.1 ABC-type polysaccharide/polyol phosphate export systems permease component [Solimicrobium silvestre]